jgi:glycerol-3-phosphate dehydrogenase (NAD(P)+)
LQEPKADLQKRPARKALMNNSVSHTVGVVGAGSWGTALGLLLDQNGHTVTVWGHDPAALETTRANRENASYLPGVELPESMRFTPHLESLRESEFVIFCTPSRALREVACRLGSAGLLPHSVLVSCTKGLERGSGLRMSQILDETLPGHVVGVLSGPGHAEEVARGVPTAVVVGSAHTPEAEALQRLFSNRFFRAYTSLDVAGMELGGALKNIFAIAAGVADGLGLGDNTKAALVTRSLAEMTRLGSALGGQRETFSGLSGIGDLMVTCFSRHSRNRAVGERLGHGESIGTITASMRMVAEGVPAAYSAFDAAKRLGIDVPIIGQIRALLEGQLSARDAMHALLTRDLRSE